VTALRLKRVTFIENRIKKLRASFRFDTQQLRYSVINRLTEMFNAASHLAKSRDLELKDRQVWTRIAGYIAQTIESMSKGYDERQIDSELEELEKMIHEAKAKTKTEEAQKGTSSRGANTASKGSC
jgi:ArsR family metal-binding transcriptional regulator